MSAVRRSAPPAQSIQLRRWELTSGDELRSLRRDLQAALHGYGLTAPGRSPVAEQALLVVTELASNALRHGRPPAVVRLLRADDCFILEVADGDVRSAPELAAAGHADDGGRGLHIARSLAREVCWYATGQTKHIWASFPAEVPGSPTSAGPESPVAAASREGPVGAEAVPKPRPADVVPSEAPKDAV